MAEKITYFIYILKCADGTLYTGYTTDIEKRLTAHNSPTKGAKYTRSRQPVTLVYQEAFGTLSEALKRENAIKSLSREEKQLLFT